MRTSWTLETELACQRPGCSLLLLLPRHLQRCCFALLPRQVLKYLEQIPGNSLKCFQRGNCLINVLCASSMVVACTPGPAEPLTWQH
jgi:hypothetical protein